MILLSNPSVQTKNLGIFLNSPLSPNINSSKFYPTYLFKASLKYIPLTPFSTASTLGKAVLFLTWIAIISSLKGLLASTAAPSQSSL